MSETIETVKQFKDTPQGQQERWTVELKAAEENLKEWVEQGNKAVKKYLGEGGTLNIFHANVDTKLGIVYGQVPSVDVSRRWGDSQDDVARVASEMMERVLQIDLEREDDGYQAALRYGLKDWQIVGLGQAWLRYEVETETKPEQPAIMGDCPTCRGTGQMMGMGGMDTEADTTESACPDCEGGGQQELAPAVPAQEVKSWEDAEIDYVYWEDFRYQPSRSWHDCDWVAKRVWMTRDELNERFGEDKAKLVPMEKRSPPGSESVREDVKDIWSRAEVWEIWCKSSKGTYWVSKGMTEILEYKPDPLGLKDFFPCPRPIVSNVTTSKFIPKPDYCISEKLYQEIDDLFSRIMALEDCARVRWVYDKTFPELSRLFSETDDGEGIGVGNWSIYKDKGGMAGLIEFAPIDPIVQAIAVLTQNLNEKMGLLYQATGLSDIVRGYSNPNETLGAQKIKAGFAGTRLQSDQDEVARYASEILQIRAEIIQKHFDPQTIVDRSNVMRTSDAQLAEQAVMLLKDKGPDFRVSVKADSIALKDYAALKAERVETVQAIGGLMQQSVPVIQAFPPYGAFALKLAAWLIASTKGSQTMESDFDTLQAQADQAAQAAMAPKPPPPPDPKVIAEQQKAQASVQVANIGVQEAGIGLQREKIGLVKELAKAAQPKPPPGPGGIPNA
jgi:hypothetical protein